MEEQVKLGIAISAARLLADDGSNREYMRGMCELLATCFPMEDVEPEERAQWFEREVLKQG